MAVFLAVGFVVAVVASLPNPEPPTTRRLLWVAEKSTAASGVMPDGLVAAARGASAHRGGELLTYAVGREAELLPVLSLEVLQNGDVLQNVDHRRKVIDRRLEDLHELVASAPVGGEGFSLYAALRAIADEAAKSEPIEVWFSSAILSSTIDPFLIAALTAAPS
jgi:hypothetical protein